MRATLAWQTGSQRPQVRFHAAKLQLVRLSGARLSGVLLDDLGMPVDISASDASLLFCVRLAGGERLTAQVACTKLEGREGINGYVTTAAPYDEPGSGGRFLVLVPPEAFEEVGEYEGELVLFREAGGDPEPIFDLARIYVRDNLFGRPLGTRSVLLNEDGTFELTESGELLLME